MSSREKILSQINANKPSSVALAEVPLLEGEASIHLFKKNLETISGQMAEASSEGEIETLVKNLFPAAKQIASNMMQGTVWVDEHTDRATLEQIDVAVLKGDFGVAENGAVWLPEANMMNRSLPFIAQYLVLVIKKSDIVANMHEAYARCRAESYGSFIAGPSKTADIEQALVIGAHGARSLTVIVVLNSVNSQLKIRG